LEICKGERIKYYVHWNIMLFMRWHCCYIYISPADHNGRAV
jgi:hypothetical protein